MQRIKLLVFIVLCLVFLFTNHANPARQVKQDQAQTAKLRRLKWVKVTDGVKVLRLWDTQVGPQWPQIAVLQLSTKEHQRLERDPMAFLLEFKVFGDAKLDGIRGHSELVLSEEKTPGDDPSGEWVTVAVHDRTTYSGYCTFEVQAITP